LPAAVALAWLWACLWYPLTDTDIWWHLAAAKLMWARGAFLRADPFCLSSLGAPWTDLHWGFQLLAYGAWKLGGARALVAGKCLATAGAFAFALRPHLHRRTWPWLIPLAAFGIYQVRFYIDVRPLALTLLGLGIQYAAVMAYLRGRSRRPWLAIVPVQIALANVQGLYPLGAVLVACLAAGEYAARILAARFPGRGWAAPADQAPLRPLAWTCLAMGAAGFATPYGWAGFLLPFSLFGRIAPQAANIFSREIAENLPFAGLLARDPGAALPLLAFMLAVAYTFLRARSRPSPGHALLFLAFAGLGWMAQRNLPLAVLAGLMAAGRNLEVSLGAGGTGSGGRRAASPAGWAALAAVVLVYAPKLRAAWDYELPGAMETPFRFPGPAVGFLEAHPLPGNLFNELRYGGYIAFRLHPKLAFVDGRMILRSGDFYRDFLEVADRPGNFGAYRAKHGLTHALLPIAEDQRFLPLAAHLLRSGWALLYCDGAAVLLADPGILSGGTGALRAPADAIGSVRPFNLDSLPADHPLTAALRARFSANPRLQSLAAANAVLFLRAAGKARAAGDLARAIPAP
jgi:hypothetical protein